MTDNNQVSSIDQAAVVNELTPSSVAQPLFRLSPEYVQTTKVPSDVRNIIDRCYPSIQFEGDNLNYQSYLPLYNQGFGLVRNDIFIQSMNLLIGRIVVEGDMRLDTEKKLKDCQNELQDCIARRNLLLQEQTHWLMKQKELEAALHESNKLLIQERKEFERIKQEYVEHIEKLNLEIKERDVALCTMLQDKKEIQAERNEWNLKYRMLVKRAVMTALESTIFELAGVSSGSLLELNQDKKIEQKAKCLGVVKKAFDKLKLNGLIQESSAEDLLQNIIDSRPSETNPGNEEAHTNINRLPKDELFDMLENDDVAYYNLTIYEAVRELYEEHSKIDNNAAEAVAAGFLCSRKDLEREKKNKIQEDRCKSSVDKMRAMRKARNA